MINIKLYKEKRAEYEKKMNDMLDLAQIEERALTDEEAAEFDDLEKKIQNIDRTVAAEERARKLELTNEDSQEQDEEKRTEDTQKAEMRAFANYVRGVVSEERAENLTTAETGAVMPTSRLFLKYTIFARCMPLQIVIR